MFNKAKLIIDVQGDEPLVDPKDIDNVIDFHKKNKHFDIVLPVKNTKNPEDKSLIKVAFSKKKKLFFLVELKFLLILRIKILHILKIYL